MPNAKVLSEKQAIVEALTQRISNAASGVLVDYKGINVAEDTALRRELRAAGIEYTVVKNTLLRFAVDKCNFNEFDSLLNGTTSLATTEGDPIAPIRIVSENAKKLNGKFEIKGGFMEGRSSPWTSSTRSRSFPARTPCIPRCSELCWHPSPAWPSYWARSWSRRAAPWSPPSPPPNDRRTHLII